MLKKFIKFSLLLNIVLVFNTNEIQAMKLDEAFQTLRFPTPMSQEVLSHADQHNIAEQRKRIRDAEKTLEQDGDSSNSNTAIEKIRKGEDLNSMDILSIQQKANNLLQAKKIPEDNALGAVHYTFLAEHHGRQGNIKSALSALSQAGLHDPDAERTYRILYHFNGKVAEAQIQGFLAGAGAVAVLGTVWWWYSGR